MASLESLKISVVPEPARWAALGGQFTLTPETAILADARLQGMACYLRDLLAPATGLELPIRDLDRAGTGHDSIALVLAEEQSHLGPEGYALRVVQDGVEIAAPAPAGIFYGVQTLRQLLPAQPLRPQVESPTVSSLCDRSYRPLRSSPRPRGHLCGSALSLPCVEVEDHPRFPWRGYMLDEGRHFHGQETVLRTLDLMALHKLNVLHWHLTEDQGWRIEIQRYPRLTGVGSMRAGTATRRLGRGHDGVPHGGFYTQQEVREIVAYAAERQIAIVPEVEMPGHCRAALAAYPELSCTGGPFEVACHFGIMLDIFCVGKEQVFAFLQGVLDEVMDLFPSPYVHIGGDEVFKARWRRCPDCQARMRQEGLKNAHELQVYFTNRIAAYLSAHGRRAVGWNDMLQEGLAENAVVQYWIRNRKGAVAAIQGGRDAVISSFLYTYLDHSFSLTPLSKAYRFEPLFPGLDEASAKHVLGLEGPMWTEFVPDRTCLDYQTYPRLTALAEVGWSPREKRAYGDFRRRLASFLPRLDRLGVGYAPQKDWEPSRLKRLFGVFTILQPRTKTSMSS